ncbi:MAG: HEAT repeat domain-containing protein, partial [Akkermansiaceae bacterium]
MASAQDLPYLIQLLDDDDPEVQKAVCSGLKTMGGDISENLAAQGISLSKYKQRKVSQLLRGGRREELMEAWLTPSNGFSSLDHDWESLEHYLRLISDFLHDGITLRASLTDQLDILADELREELLIPSEQGVYDWMFGEGKFENREKAKAIDYDLCHVIESDVSEKSQSPSD